MQWLITAQDNGRIRDRWGELFPTLEPDEALLEGAYTAETHRGQGIMSHAMARIAAAAGKLGARRVITFVHHANIASLKGCERAGFAPYIERREAWSLFRRRIRFLPLNGTPPRSDTVP
jgi:RimJ/RimL family protein N-acetyltransferase